MGNCFGNTNNNKKEHSTHDLQTITTKFKIVLVGESDVGKSCLIHRFSTDQFPAPAEAHEIAEKTIKINNHTVAISVFDTQGMEKFKTITSSFYDGSGGIILVYDITSPSSFDALSANWFRECERYAPESELMLVGNKIDLNDQRQVEFVELQKLAESKSIPFQEVSAHTGEGVREAFEKLIKLMTKDDVYGTSAESEDANGKTKKKKKGEDSDGDE